MIGGKQIINSFLMLALTGFVNAQNDLSAKRDTVHTLLWEVTGKNLVRPSYVFGTMHIMCAGDAQISQGLKKVIASCDEIFFEIDLSDINSMLNSLKYLRMNNETKLSDLLSPEDYEKVKAYFKKHVSMLPFGMLERFKPLLISSMIEEQGMGCKATDGMEMEIMKEANLSSKKINGLETVEFQAQLFDSIPYQRQAHDLVNYIDSIDEYTKTMDTLMKVYKEQDLDKIDKLSRAGDVTVSDYVDLLLNGRNRNWVTKMGQLMPTRSVLFAVGAAHLPGEFGVIELLRRNGYRVEPLRN
ncbi:MAG TPA: TraB/GumN family protein [Puia sp.]|nr:TraB/GumN family protein [Puia sp.]